MTQVKEFKYLKVLFMCEGRASGQHSDCMSHRKEAKGEDHGVGPLSWPLCSFRFHQQKWRRILWTGRSRYIFLGCCPHDPVDKLEKLDG